MKYWKRFLYQDTFSPSIGKQCLRLKKTKNLKILFILLPDKSVFDYQMKDK